ncbi:MAG: alpha/beta hydrolase family protein [Planctomycetota bacterium]
MTANLEQTSDLRPVPQTSFPAPSSQPLLQRARRTAGQTLGSTLLAAVRPLTISCLVLVAAIAGGHLEAAPRVLPAGQLPQDQRLQPLKDLDGYFPFTPSSSPQEWQQRAERVRRQILVSQGLWPLPKPTPLNPVIHGKVERDGFTVERVYFESLPGFFVTGSLYRPTKAASGKRPGVLCPHGHWNNGRFYDNGEEGVKKEIADGAEKYPEGGRSPLQARCMQLARMGCVVFHYDMIGYADNKQLSFELAHRFAKQRPEMNTVENWGLYSPQAETHLQSIMGLQTLNSIRSLDFLLTLPDVDPARIGVTGASGGGTQTMLLGAIDPRPAVAYPAVMVSTAMQGGCTCENCSLLRVDTGNIEFSAMFAPKPQGMSAANDWTKEMETKGFPQIKKQYELLGAADNVMLKATINFGHNYNYVNRAAMYNWFNKHLKIGLPEPIEEGDYKRLSIAEMTVWDDQHPAPPSGDDFERRLVSYWHQDAQEQLAALTPTDNASWKKYQQVVGGAIDILVGRTTPASKDVSYEQTHKSQQGNHLLMTGLVRVKARGEELPVAFLHPQAWNGRVVIWLSEAGKAGLFADGDRPRPEVQQLVDAGISVVGVDLLYQGEFLPAEAAGRLEKTPRVKNPREFAGYTFGYNSAVLASRVHDVLSIVAFARGYEKPPTRIDLVGLNGTGPIAALAKAQAGEAITATAIDTRGFRFGKLLELHDPNFLPGGAKYGDLPGILSLAAPGKLWVTGEGEKLPAIVQAAYGASGQKAHAQAFSGPAADASAAAVAWILKN